MCLMVAPVAAPTGEPAFMPMATPTADSIMYSAPDRIGTRSSTAEACAFRAALVAGASRWRPGAPAVLNIEAAAGVRRDRRGAASSPAARPSG